MALIIRGDVIRAARERRGWSRQDLADRTQLSERTLTRIEKDEGETSRPSTTLSLSRALELDMEEFIIELPDPPPPPPPPEPVHPPGSVEEYMAMRQKKKFGPLPPAPLPKDPYQYFHAAFRAEQRRIFNFAAWVCAIEPLTDVERIALGCWKRGVGARFEVKRRAGRASSMVTLYSNLADQTRALGEALSSGRAVDVGASVVVVQGASEHPTMSSSSDLPPSLFVREWRGFTWTGAFGKHWWALVAKDVTPAKPKPRKRKTPPK